MSKAILNVTIINIISAILSFIVGVLLAREFGGSGELSAYFAAFNIIIPLNLLLLKAHSKSFIPFISNTKRSYKKLTKALLKFNFILFCGFGILIFILAPVLPIVLSPGLNHENKEITSLCIRIFSLYVISSNLSGFFQGVLHSKNKFAIPALMQALAPFCMILSLSILGNRFGVITLPLTYTVAITISATILFLVSKTHFFLKGPTKLTNYKSDIKEYIQLATPIIVSSVFIWIISFADVFMASFLTEESISYLEYARKIAQQTGILTASIAVVYFPLLSALSKKNDSQNYLKILAKGTEQTFLITSFIASILLLNSEDIISIIYERGAFNKETTLHVSTILKFYIGIVLFAPLGTFFSNIYNSKKLPTKQAIFSVISSLVNIGLNTLFVFVFNLREKGLAAASSIAYLVGITLQIAGLRKIIDINIFKTIILPLLKILLLQSLICVVVIQLSNTLSTYANQPFLLALKIGTHTILTFMVFYFTDTGQLKSLIKQSKKTN